MREDFGMLEKREGRDKKKEQRQVDIKSPKGASRSICSDGWGCVKLE